VQVKKRSELRQVTIVTEHRTEVPFRMPRQFPKSFKDYTAAENRGVEECPRVFYAKHGRMQSKCRSNPVRRTPYGGSGLRNPQGSLGYGRAGFLFFLKMLVQSPYPFEVLGALGEPVVGFRQELISIDMNRNHGSATHRG
jgi:hypothetical protein